MWDQGANETDTKCYSACNNWQCNHRYCTLPDILEKCLAETAAGDSITTAPKAPTPVQFQMSFDDRMELELDESGGSNVATAHITYALQWEDSRLFSTPCRAVLSEMLSFTDAESEEKVAQKRSYAESFWLPTFQINELDSYSVSNQTFSVADSMPWLQRAPPGSGAQCTDCAKLELTGTVKVRQPGATFGYWHWFPFDKHEVIIDFSTSLASFVCDSALNEAPFTRSWLNDNVLPRSGEWTFTGSESVTMENVLADKCRLRITLQRNALVFLTKNLVISLIVVFGCLLSGYMHPGEHTGKPPPTPPPIAQAPSLELVDHLRHPTI
jgi:hypothetical protein